MKKKRRGGSDWGRDAGKNKTREEGKAKLTYCGFSG